MTRCRARPARMTIAGFLNPRQSAVMMAAESSTIPGNDVQGGGFFLSGVIVPGSVRYIVQQHQGETSMDVSGMPRGPAWKNAGCRTGADIVWCPSESMAFSLTSMGGHRSPDEPAREWMHIQIDPFRPFNGGFTFRGVAPERAKAQLTPDRPRAGDRCRITAVWMNPRIFDGFSSEFTPPQNHLFFKPLCRPITDTH